MTEPLTNETVARIIRDYWTERGYPVQAEVRECFARGQNGGEWPYQGVRSDMLDGLPAGYRGPLAARRG